MNEQLLELSREYTEALKANLAKQLISVVLFGSAAREEATAFSDIDLLVIAADLPRGRFARRKMLEPADKVVEERLSTLREQGVASDFCVILQTPEEAKPIRPLYLDMVEDAILLYDREGFFAGILAQLRRSLERLGARRLWLGKIRYWDLKPDYIPGEIFEL